MGVDHTVAVSVRLGGYEADAVHLVEMVLTPVTMKDVGLHDLLKLTKFFPDLTETFVNRHSVGGTLENLCATLDGHEVLSDQLLVLVGLHGQEADGDHDQVDYEGEEHHPSHPGGGLGCGGGG